MSYSQSHVILIAFAIDVPDSLDNVTHKVRHPSLPRREIHLTQAPAQWIEEVRSICGPNIPVILVGCKSDLRPPPGTSLLHYASSVSPSQLPFTP